MVAKILGLATGALVASVGVWAFNDWRHISDEDRLGDVINKHCIPYVTTGLTPFSEMGRPVGVYDDADLKDDITDGGSAILFDNRFVAQWGVTNDGRSDLRVCIVNDSYARANSSGFEVDPNTFLDWDTDLVSPNLGIVARREGGDAFPRVLIWEEPDAAQYTGLRLYLTVQEGGVSNVMVVDDLAD